MCASSSSLRTWLEVGSKLGLGLELELGLGLGFGSGSGVGLGSGCRLGLGLELLPAHRWLAGDAAGLACVGLGLGLGLELGLELGLGLGLGLGLALGLGSESVVGARAGVSDAAGFAVELL